MGRERLLCSDGTSRKREIQSGCVKERQMEESGRMSGSVEAGPES